ncbi:MAG: hypothetical protein LKCHEGNO_01534 [Burkholderiaceae bacterium]|nr:hypothetical protein [Burkholderiaceae bacterium]
MINPLITKIARDCFRIDPPIKVRADVLTVANDNSRSLLHDGKYYSPLVDTLQDDLRARGLRCISVARIISSLKGKLSYGTVVSPEGGFARALVQKRLAALFARRYPYSRMEEAEWGRILDGTQARKIIAIQPSRELCTAARRRGLWVADLQHGVIADMHPWYGAAFRANEPLEQLPHAFLCWDEGSARVIARWAHKRGLQTPVIGNRWLARFVRPSPEDRLVHELQRRYAPAAGSQRAMMPTVLVSLSWGEDNISNGFIAEGLLRAMHKMAGSMRWEIRLHPNQVLGFAKEEGRRFRKFYERELVNIAAWHFATTAPLPIVLQSVDLHISWTSSVCIDAAQMGIRSALLNPRLRQIESMREYFGHYQRCGLVDLVADSEDAVLSWIAGNLRSKRAPAELDACDAEYRALLEFLSK